MIPSVVLYAKPVDPYSARARAFLTAKRIAFEERELPAHSQEMILRTGSSQVPQILINGISIGGFEELGSLELRGELDKLLRG